MRAWTVELLIGLLLIGAYEVRAHVGDDYRTLTALLRAATQHSPMLAVVVGIIVGHLFWPR